MRKLPLSLFSHHSAKSSIQFKAENALMNTRIENAILVQNLRKKYGDAEVLKGVNLKIEEGEFYALMVFFNQGKMPLETETGYRIYSNKADEATPKIVRMLERLGCKVTKIETVRPSLEDVYFKLTQKSLRSGEPQ